jgi:hypothetical protein
VSVFAAAALLVGVIVAPHIVRPMGIRIGIAGMPTVIFATSIMLLSQARRMKVYGATAAFDAHSASWLTKLTALSGMEQYLWCSLV